MLWLTCDATVQTGEIERVGLGIGALSPDETVESKLIEFCEREGWRYMGDPASWDDPHRSSEPLPEHAETTYSPADRREDGYWRFEHVE